MGLEAGAGGMEHTKPWDNSSQVVACLGVALTHVGLVPHRLRHKGTCN